jgi:hypothetical protein
MQRNKRARGAVREAWVIRSCERPELQCWFIAIHGSSPMYGRLAHARRFPSYVAARDYARAELFTVDSAFVVVSVVERGQS